jgi:hypothetical protein
MKQHPTGRNDELVVQQLKDEILIYDLKDNKAYCLNETSALVWQMCDGNNSITDISKQLSKKLNSTVDDDFVWLAIDGLKKDNLLADSEELVPEFNGMSRREVIRKVGLASLIALPVISSLVAPTAAMAASNCQAAGQTCTFSDNTQSNCCSGLRCTRGRLCVDCSTTGTFVGSCSSAGCCSTTRLRNRCCSSTVTEEFDRDLFFCRCA